MTLPPPAGEGGFINENYRFFRELTGKWPMQQVVEKST
jgi:hypothetical protein